MAEDNDDLPVALYATCPPWMASATAAEYRRDVERVARLCEDGGCRGILVYTDNSQPDPWLVAQIVIAATRELRPLVAVQPAYMHPFSAARSVLTLALAHGRAVDLNLVSGGFKNDLTALGDAVAHDDRYRRLVEYASILRDLLSGQAVTFHGAFHDVAGLRLPAALPRALMPDLFVAGSSPAGAEAARALGAVAVKYPGPAAEEAEFAAHQGRKGIRVSLVARATEEEGWSAAHARYPGDRKGQLMRQLALKVSDSQWHQRLGSTRDQGEGPYWLFPFHNYRTNCPCLVGSYTRVGEELSRYLAMGAEAVILDVPADADEIGHARAALRAALQGAAP